jgi:crossover junction endodeoxyribonuclease RusA
MKARTLTLDLPLPPKELQPNQRPHWAVKARATKSARTLAKAMARGEMRGKPFKRASIHMQFYLARRQDQDNLISWTKATRDGLQDAGVIENDSGFIIHPPQQASGKAAGGKRGLVLTVIEELT